jgi:hypothetical protein
MTKEEFAQMERAQQKIWKELAESGENSKSNTVYIPFYHGCPACTIADAAFTNSIVENCGGRCVFCPVDLWRDSFESCASCQGRCGDENFVGTLEDISKLPLFGQWVVLADLYSKINCSNDKIIEARKKAALEISKLEFSWLEEYEAVELEQTTKDYLKGEEEYGC